MRVYLDDCYGASAVDYIVIFNCLIDLIGNSFNCFGRILIIVLAIAAIVIGVVVWNNLEPNSMPIWLQRIINP